MTESATETANAHALVGKPAPYDRPSANNAADAGTESADPAQTATADACDDGGEYADDDGSETAAAETPSARSIGRRRRIRRSHVVAYGVLPVLVLTLAISVVYVKWLNSSARQSQLAATESVRVATDSTIALLSYNADTVEQDLGAAGQRLTGKFKDSYTALTRDVVIPGSKQKRVSAVATVPAAASVSANADSAVVLIFVNQTVTVGNDSPTHTDSSMRVTLEKVAGRWLISQFEPV